MHQLSLLIVTDRTIFVSFSVKRRGLALKHIKISFPVNPIAKFGAERTDSRAESSVLDMKSEGFRLLVFSNCDTSRIACLRNAATKFGAERSGSHAEISVLDMKSEGFRASVSSNCDTPYK